MLWRHVTGATPPEDPLSPGTHQLLLALNHSQRGLVGVAVLSARVPVSRFLREEVAFSSIEQPVLWAGRFTLDTALGSCREERGGSASNSAPAPPPWPCLAPPGSRRTHLCSLQVPPPASTLVPFTDLTHEDAFSGGTSHRAWQEEGWWLRHKEEEFGGLARTPPRGAETAG